MPRPPADDQQRAAEGPELSRPILAARRADPTSQIPSECDYGWAWLAPASPRHYLLIRRSPTDPADLAFCYCHVPAGRAYSFTTLVRTAGRR